MRESWLALISFLGTCPSGTQSLFREEYADTDALNFGEPGTDESVTGKSSIGRQGSKRSSKSSKGESKSDTRRRSKGSTRTDRGYNSDPYETNVGGGDDYLVQTPGTQPLSATAEPSLSPTMSEPTISNDNVFRGPTETYVPTMGPTPKQPIKRKCDLAGILGAYGTISRDRRQFDFYYQAETSPSVTQQVFSNELLGLLEKELGAMLLPFLFKECREEGRKLQATEDTCEVKGFSRLPFDRVMVGVSCVGSREEPSNNCFVIEAGVRVHFNPDGDCSNANERTMQVIRETISSKEITDIDPRIISVAYLNASDINFEDEITNVSEGSVSQNKIPGYGLILLAFAALALIAPLLFLIGRRRKQREERHGVGVIPDEA